MGIASKPLSQEYRDRLFSLIKDSDDSVLQAILFMESLGDVDFSSVLPVIYQNEHVRLYHMSYSRGEACFEDGVFVVQDVVVSDRFDAYEPSIRLKLFFPSTKWEVSFVLSKFEKDIFSAQRTNTYGVTEGEWMRVESTID